MSFIPKFRSIMLATSLGICMFAPLSAQAEGTPSAIPQPTEEALQTIGTQYVNAALWQQTAAERKALCYQTYNMATHIIKERIESGHYIKRNGKLCEEINLRTADGKFFHSVRPLAVILDLDETVFDSSDYASWMTLNPSLDNYYNLTRYFDYQSQLTPPATVPGVVEFVKQCKSWGVTAIFITDRDTSYREQCLRALRNAGLDSPTLEKELLCRDKDRDEATAERIITDLNLDSDHRLTQELTDNASKKSPRRQVIASYFKVLATFGDDLYDHAVIVDKHATGQEARDLRDDQVHINSDHFGRDWFILPNAMHGSWRGSAGFPLTDPHAPVEALRAACAPLDAWMKAHPNEPSK